MATRDPAPRPDERTVTTRSRPSDAITSQLWGLCSVLKDDGITFHEYLGELTLLLYLKLARDMGRERDIPPRCRWDALVVLEAQTRLDLYRKALTHLAASPVAQVRMIFEGAVTGIKSPQTLDALFSGIDRLGLLSVESDELGDIYEGLLDRNANEKKAGAGQYFTPRPLVETITRVMKPTLADRIQDPAAGTGGFLIAAANHIRQSGNPTPWTAAEKRKFRERTFYGMEHVRDTHRLATMNLSLHGITSHPHGAGVHYGDTLSDEGTLLPQATLILTNPPFGTKSGHGLPSRTDLSFRTSNKQLSFLQHIYRALGPGGRAAVVVPDNVLFESNTARRVREELLQECRLTFVLRLPVGIFYAAGVKTHVLFFERRSSRADANEKTWLYDLRTDMPTFGRRNRLTARYFSEFEAGYNALDRAPATPASELPYRFRPYTYSQIAHGEHRMDFQWTADPPQSNALQSRPDLQRTLEELTQSIERALKAARELLDDVSVDR